MEMQGTGLNTAAVFVGDCLPARVAQCSIVAKVKKSK